MSSHVEFRFKYLESKPPHDRYFERFQRFLWRALNWTAMSAIFTSTCVTGAINLRFKNWNMKLFCNDPDFNHKETDAPRSILVLTILILSFLSLSLMWTRIYFLKMSLRRRLSHLANYIAGFLLCWVLTFFIQGIISYPKPSFYHNANIRLVYCTNQTLSESVLKQVDALDGAARASFPSWSMCALGYSITHVFLYSYYLDVAKSTMIKLAIFCAPALASCYYGTLLWKFHVNHLVDIFGGAILGGTIGVFIMLELLIEKYSYDRFKDDFVTVLLAREIALSRLTMDMSCANAMGDESENERTVNLFPEARPGEVEPQAQHLCLDEDAPPPYWSL